MNPLDPTAFAVLERVHGHLAVLGLAVLVHPILTLRRRGLSPRTRLTADLAALLLGLPYLLGLFIYPTYRSGIKPGLVDQQLAAAHAFETKEHLAVACIALVVGGAAMLRLAGGLPQGRRAAWWLLLGGLVCGLCTAVLGVWVAAVG